MGHLHISLNNHQAIFVKMKTDTSLFQSWNAICLFTSICYRKSFATVIILKKTISNIRLRKKNRITAIDIINLNNQNMILFLSNQKIWSQGNRSKFPKFLSYWIVMKQSHKLKACAAVKYSKWLGCVHLLHFTYLGGFLYSQDLWKAVSFELLLIE